MSSFPKTNLLPLPVSAEESPLSLDTLFQSLVANAPLGIGFLDRDLRYLYISPYLAELNGVPAADHLGRTVSEAIPELAPILEPILQRVLATKRPVLDLEFTRRATAHSLERRWLAQYYPMQDAQGAITGIGGLVMDLTEPYRVQDALHQTKQNLADVLKAARMGLWDWDLATDAVRWSDHCGEIFGFGPDVAQARDEQTEYRHEYRVVLPDGTPRWVEAKGRFEYDPQGQPCFESLVRALSEALAVR